MLSPSYLVFPVGIVHVENDAARIEIHEPFEPAMLGLEGFSHITLIYWFHQNDTPSVRKTLQVRPRKNPNNPVTGVFATHSPARPNLLATTPCRILRIEGRNIFIDDTDARDGSPVIDIKPYIPLDKLDAADIRVPDWVNTPRKN